jgi:tetratricopeptide (TPR) repeat protein
MDLTRGARGMVIAGLLIGAVPAGTAAQAQGKADPYYDFLLGRHLHATGETKSALAALERAAAADPRAAEVRAEIASVHSTLGDRDAAITAAKEAVSLDLENVEANRILGMLYAEAAESPRNTGAQTAAYVRDAITHLERALSGSQGPADLNLHVQLGRMYLATNESRKAVEILDRVVSQNPYSLRARVLLSQAYASARDLPMAIMLLEEVAGEAPQVLPVLGQYLQRAGRLSDAISAFTKALESQPNSAQIKLQRILVMNEARLYAQAATAAADAQRQHPDEPTFPRMQADALFKAGQQNRAIEVLEASARAFPRDSATRLALAGLYSDAGREDDAEKVLRQMIASEPSNANALNHLGYLLARNRRNLDEAISLVNRALTYEPGNGAYLDSLGWAYFQQGDLAQAEKYLGAAAERLPQNSEIQDHLGDLHARRGNWQEAMAAWQRALDGDGSGIDPAAVQKKIDDASARSGR